MREENYNNLKTILKIKYDTNIDFINELLEENPNYLGVPIINSNIEFVRRINNIKPLIEWKKIVETLLNTSYETFGIYFKEDTLED